MPKGLPGVVFLRQGSVLVLFWAENKSRTLWQWVPILAFKIR
jgi:hypothetical protein